MNPTKITKSELKQELAFYQHHTQALQQTLARTQAQVELYQAKIGLFQRGWTAANGRANESREILALLHMVILMKETKIEDLKNLLERMTMAVLSQEIELGTLSENFAMECDTTTVLQQLVTEKEAIIQEAIRIQGEICEQNKRSMDELIEGEKTRTSDLITMYEDRLKKEASFYDSIIQQYIKDQAEVCEQSKKSMNELAINSKDCMQELAENYKKLTTENIELRTQLNKAVKFQLIPMTLLGILGLYILYVTLTARQNM